MHYAKENSQVSAQNNFIFDNPVNCLQFYFIKLRADEYSYIESAMVGAGFEPLFVMHICVRSRAAPLLRVYHLHDIMRRGTDKEGPSH